MKAVWILLLWIPLLGAAQDKVLLREGYFIRGSIDSFAEKSLFMIQDSGDGQKEIPAVMINKVFLNGAEIGLSFNAASQVFKGLPVQDSTTIDSQVVYEPNHLLLAGENMLAGFQKLTDITTVTVIGGLAYVIVRSADGTENLQMGILVGAGALNVGLFIASLNNFVKASKHFIKAVQTKE